MITRLATAAPALIAAAALAAAGIWAIAHSIRAGRRNRIPAAPDNQQGRDEGLLQLCRLIAITKPASRKGKKP